MGHRQDGSGSECSDSGWESARLTYGCVYLRKKIENDDDDGAAAVQTWLHCELCSQSAASKRLLVRMHYPSVRLRSEFLTGFSSPHCTRSLHFHYIRFTRIAGSSGSAGSSRSVCPPDSHCIIVPLLFASSAQTTTLNFLSEQQRAPLN